MSTETNSFVSALAQANGFIPSLHNLAVETIKTFVNPGIKELEKILLEDSERIFTQNNSLRCISENHQNEWLRELSEEVGTIEERTSRITDVLDHMRFDTDCIERRTDNMQRLMCGPDGPHGTDLKLYDRVADLNSEVDEIKTMLKEMNEKLDLLCNGVSTTKPRRKRKREDKE